MSINAESYRKAVYPPPLRSPQYLSDEDVSFALDKLPKRRKPARPESSSPEATKSQGDSVPAKANDA